MAYQSTATVVPVAPRNGFGITALVLALIGLVFGLVPLTGFLALILGMLAVLFGSLGWARARRGGATNRKMTVIGAALGIGAVALGIWGMTIVFGTFDKIGKGLSGQGGAAVTGSDRPGMSAPTEAVNQVAFGQSFTYEDGAIIAVAAPVPYQPSSTSAIGAGSARAVAMSVTVTNGTAKPLSLAGVSLQAAAGDQAAEQIFDSAKGVGMSSQTLPPGKRQTFTVAFGVPSGPTEFRVQATPSWFGYQPVFFVGQVDT
jgi:hypothetical protein